MRRITVSQGRDGWTIDEHWTSVQLKSFFNDFVVHNGHAFGFVGPSLACIDLGDGRFPANPSRWLTVIELHIHVFFPALLPF